MTGSRVVFGLTAAAFGIFAGAVLADQGEVDGALSAYRPVEGVSGSIKSVGSDTMNNEMALWAEGFRKHYPSVQVEIEGKGSTTAPRPSSRAPRSSAP